VELYDRMRTQLKKIVIDFAASTDMAKYIIDCVTIVLVTLNSNEEFGQSLEVDNGHRTTWDAYSPMSQVYM
jgi:hypothetical protein